MIRLRPVQASICAVALKLSARRAGVEHLADRDIAGDELGARHIDIGNDQVKTLRRAGWSGRDFRTELYRAGRTGRGKLDDSEAVIKLKIRIQSPPYSPIELLCAVD